MAWTSIALLIALIAIIDPSRSDPCPFSQYCDCAPSFPPVDYLYFSVSCAAPDGSLVIFTPQEQKYAVKSTVSISGDFSSLPPRYLETFSMIPSLQLSPAGTPSPPAPMNWDPAAFDGVQIDELQVSHLNILPLPAGVSVGLADKLQSMRINYADDLRLVDDGLATMKKLNTFYVYSSNMSRLDSRAFAGLDSVLTTFDVTSFKLADGGEFPFDVLTHLKSLQTLKLFDVNLKHLEPNAFLAFPSLTILNLISADLATSIENGALDQLPSTLGQLVVSSVGMKTIPKKGLASAPSLAWIDFSWNQITTIHSDDFASNILADYVDVDDNPITSIEPNAFAQLANVEYLYGARNNMTSIDLAIFNGVNSKGAAVSKQVLIDMQSSALQKVYATNATDFPDGSLVFVQWMVQTIDSSVAQIFEQKKRVVFDLTFNTNFQCDDNLRWMAKYVLCTGNIEPKDAKCSDGRPLLDFMKSIGATCDSPVKIQ